MKLQKDNNNKKYDKMLPWGILTSEYEITVDMRHDIQGLVLYFQHFSLCNWDFITISGALPVKS